MPSWRDFPLPDGSYADATRPWSQQDVVNYLPTFAEVQNTRSPVLLRTAPGMRYFAYVGDGPHRGAHNCEGKRFVVSGKKLYQVATDGTSTVLGTIPGTGRVSMAHNQIANGNEVIIGTVDNAYVWNTVTETLTAAGVPLQSVDFINQRFVGVDQQRRFWRHSALADGLTWSDLDVFSSESSPDRIVGLKVLDGEVYVFNERTIEVFVDSPTETQVFQRTVVIQRGCISGDTICRVGGKLFFVGDDYMPYRLDGYTPVPIGTKAIVGELSTHEPRRLFGMVWEDRGYLVYYVTATDGVTWGHDLTTGKWHRRESYGRDRWAVNTLCKFDRDWYAGDAYRGVLYRLEWGYVYEGCEIMPRKLRTGVLHNAGNRVSVHGLRLSMATGQGRSEPFCPDAVTLAGDLPGGELGESGTYQYLASGGVGPYTYTITSGSLPPGATMSSSGFVTYTYSAAGNYEWTVRATDSTGKYASIVDDATVYESVIACGVSASYSGGQTFPGVIGITLGSATGLVTLTCPEQGIPDKVEVWIEGIKRADSGYIGYSGTQSSLDSGLDVLGVPRETVTVSTVGQTFDFTFFKGTSTANAEVRVYAPLAGTGWGFTLGCPDTDVTSGTLTLAGAMPDPLIGYTAEYGYIAHGGVEPYTFSVVSGSLPAGRTINSATGVVSGEYKALGTFSYTLRVTDAVGTHADLADSVAVLASYP